jgi:hypothetical protein
MFDKVKNGHYTESHALSQSAVYGYIKIYPLTYISPIPIQSRGPIMLYPMFAMVLLTLAVAARLFKLRLDAVKTGKVSLGQFRLNNGTDLPTEMLQTARNYSNLFEMPVLFYAVATLTLALHLQNASMLILGWIFVGSRIAHSWIHLTHNNVIYRLQAFMLGNVCVLLMWIILVWEHTTHS